MADGHGMASIGNVGYVALRRFETYPSEVMEPEADDFDRSSFRLGVLVVQCIFVTISDFQICSGKCSNSWRSDPILD